MFDAYENKFIYFYSFLELQLDTLKVYFLFNLFIVNKKMKIKNLWVWLVQHYKWQTCMVGFRFMTIRGNFLGFVHKCEIWLWDSSVHQKLIIIFLIKCVALIDEVDLLWDAESGYKHKLFCKTVAGAVYCTLRISLVLYLYCIPQH